MTTILMGYIDRDNEEQIQLLQDGALVVASAVTKAMLRFGEYCIDTAVDTDVIYFADSDNQVLCFKLGQVEDIATGKYKGQITIFDAEADDGLAWDSVVVRILEWPVCET